MKFLAASLAASAAALATAQGTYIGAFNRSMALSTYSDASLSFDDNGVLLATQRDDAINYIDAMMMPGADGQLMKANNATDLDDAMNSAFGNVESVKVMNGYGYALGSDGYTVLNMMDYNNVTVTGQNDTQSTYGYDMHYVDTMNNMAMAVDSGDDDAITVDISNMMAPAVMTRDLDTISGLSIRRVQIVDGMFYGFDDVAIGLSIIDADGNEVGQWTGSHTSGMPGDVIYNYVTTAFKLGDKVYLLNSSPNSNGMDVVDVSDPANPVVSANYKFADPAEGEMQTAEFPAVNWSPSGPGMMTADGSRFYFPTNMGMMWFGLDDGDMPYLGCVTPSVPTTGAAMPFAIYGNDYLAINNNDDSQAFVKLFDISMDTMSCDPNHSNDGGDDDGDDDEHDDDHDHSSSASTLVAGAAAMAAAAFML